MTIVTLILIVLICFFIAKSKRSLLQKIVIVLAVILLCFITVAYLFFTGFDRGLEPTKEQLEIKEQR